MYHEKNPVEDALAKYLKVLADDTSELRSAELGTAFCSGMGAMFEMMVDIARKSETDMEGTMSVEALRLSLVEVGYAQARKMVKALSESN